VSIKSAGTITFDRPLAEDLGLAGATHVTLHFDAAKRQIGVAPARDHREEGAIKLTRRQRVCSVRAKVFFDFFGIPIDKTTRYPVALDAAGSMAIVTLGNIKRKRGPRSHKA
jgi:hypothetical protein